MQAVLAFAGELHPLTQVGEVAYGRDCSGQRIGTGRRVFIAAGFVGGGGFLSKAVAQARKLAKYIVSGLIRVAKGSTRAVPSFRNIPPIPARITGYTKHGINSAISHSGGGVSPAAILDAVRNPTRVDYDATRNTFKFTGVDAAVVLNPEGKVVTTWPRSERGRRCR